MRVLDIDLDVFVEPVEHWAAGGRLDSEDYTVWPVDEALSWLRDRCRLEGRLPGWAFEHHVELFDCWSDAVKGGELEPPFHVTHLDAHADLGLGDNGYRHLLLDVMHRPVELRDQVQPGERGPNSGDYLAWAAGCRWLNDIDYVYGPGGGSDVMPYLMDGFDSRSGVLRLAALEEEALSELLAGRRPSVQRTEPPVAIRSIRLEEFQAEAPYDVISLCRSPDYTPTSADGLYDAICETFVGTWPPGG